MQVVELIIFALLLEQLCVVALLDDLAVREHDDVVSVLDSRETVSDHKHSAYVHHLFKRILNKNLSLGVDVGSRLVKYHYRGLVDYRTRKREELTLTCREVVSSLSYYLVKTALKLVYKLVGVDVFAGLHYLGVVNSLKSEDDVGADSSREEKYVLKHLTEMAAQAGDLYLLDVDTVNKDLSLLNVVVAADEREDSGLSASRSSDERHRVACVYLEGYVLEHPFTRNIREGYVAEFDVALDVIYLDSIGLVNYLRLDVEYSEYLLSRSKRRL